MKSRKELLWSFYRVYLSARRDPDSMRDLCDGCEAWSYSAVAEETLYAWINEHISTGVETPLGAEVRHKLLQS